MPPPPGPPTPRAKSRKAATAAPETSSRSIGDIMREARHLSDAQMAQILAYHRERGTRFGEAAVALGLATPDDVMHALSVQFNYPYASEERRHRNPELVMLNQPFSPQAEAFRGLRAQILLRTKRNTGAQQATAATPPRRAVAVISPNSGDGKTYFAANLAVSLAQLGERVVIVDGDLRGPRIHDVFSMSNPSSGLSGLLSGRRGEQVIKPVTGVPNLFVLPVGTSPPNPLELIEGAAFGLLLHELLAKFDHVIVDTPAAVFGADAAVIATRCGSAIVVAREGRTRVTELQDLVGNFTSGATDMIGVVMNEY